MVTNLSFGEVSLDDLVGDKTLLLHKAFKQSFNQSPQAAESANHSISQAERHSADPNSFDFFVRLIPDDIEPDMSLDEFSGIHARSLLASRVRPALAC
jgi:hypothetical protein